MKPSTDTIAAVATAPGNGAVGIVRLSGARAFEIAQQLCFGHPLPPPRTAALREFFEATGPIDQGLVLCFQAPQSYTGEDVVELQGHGGAAVLDLLLRSAIALGARHARPGEFSERAFLNGRIDLVQAEAIADLIGAANAQAARAATRSLEGEFSRQIHALVERLTELRVYVEGALDFSDEDVDWLGAQDWREKLSSLHADLEQLLVQAQRGRRLREGAVIALTGAPNVGKSTLMNRLAGADVAIVTDVAGTTRDVLRENLDLDGLPVTLIDTAGLREGGDAIEREGMRRARAALARADLALFLLDDRAGYSHADQALAAGLPPELPLLFVHNKCDLSGRAPEVFSDEQQRQHLRLSADRGEGVDALVAAIKQRVGFAGGGEGLFSARVRHVEALTQSLNQVRSAQQRIEEHSPAELAAEDLRLAQQALGEITGQFTSDDLLGAIFRSFCIGK